VLRLALVYSLFHEEEMERLKGEVGELKKSREETQTKLAKKERECEVRTQEKEDVKKALNKIMTKLEKEQKELREYKIREKELNASVTELRAKLEREIQDRARLESLLEKACVSLPDDAKAAAGIDAANLSLRLSGGDLSSLSAVPPPPPPESAPPPPPPPIIGGSMPEPPPPPGAPGIGFATQKKIPKASHPMKSFNWSKLGELQTKSTLWKDLDDAPVFKVLDLPDFERTFSAYQKKEGSTEDLSQLKTKPKELSVVDGRRAQNCTILLSKLKMSNEELKLVVLSMDDDDEVPTDMVEQILKFVPQPDEVQLLLSHKDEIDKMARADRFLYEMSKIDHYEQRMSVLYFKKRFSERVGECRPKVEAIYCACRELNRSPRLRRLLEVVLAFGNYMNRGVRSNAFGFRISSLNKIMDTKSSTDRRVTLLHYLIETVEHKFPEVLQLENDLPNVRKAAKVNLTELETEVLALKQQMEQVKKELEYHTKQSTRELGDRFVDIVSDFQSLASVQLAELDETLIDAKVQFNKTVALFGEDPTKSQPDDFFGIFSIFLQSFEEAYQENEVMRKKKEEETRKAREMAEVQFHLLRSAVVEIVWPCLAAEREREKESFRAPKKRTSITGYRWSQGQI
jgi:dishevelled associated activator of morphogenesis